MQLSLRGWGRNHGNKRIGDIPVSDKVVVKGDPSRMAYRDRTTIHVSDDGIDATWCANLRLTGEYRVDIYLSVEDVNALFKHVHSGKISQDQLKDIGISLDDIPPSEEIIEEAVRKMKVGDFLKLVATSS